VSERPKIAPHQGASQIPDLHLMRDMAFLTILATVMLGIAIPLFKRTL
jgi:hypothetical protein